jgi:DNA-binding response OmpR family regulator
MNNQMRDKIKVLMVDDEEPFRNTTSKILSRRGYATTMAASGEEALEILRKDFHDIVVLDIKMPGISGNEALPEIKKIDPRTQVIMLTGHGNLESARDSLKHKAFDYLIKPCDIDLLDRRIRDAYGVSKKGHREEKKAGDIMIPIGDYTTIDEEATVKEGIRYLKGSYENLLASSRLMETGHRSIMVFDRNKLLTGILGIPDLIHYLQPSYLLSPKPSLAERIEYSPMFWKGMFTSQTKALANMKIKDIMSEVPPSVDEKANLMEVANMIYSQKVRRLIVTRQGSVVGIVREQELFFEMARIILEDS